MSRIIRGLPEVQQKRAKTRHFLLSSSVAIQYKLEASLYTNLYTKLGSRMAKRMTVSGRGGVEEAGTASRRRWAVSADHAGRRPHLGLPVHAPARCPQHGAGQPQPRRRPCQGCGCQGPARQQPGPPGKAKADRLAKAAELASTTTFKQAATKFIDDNKSGWKNAKHAAQWTATLETYVYPVFGNVSVADIDAPMVLKVLKPIWSTKTETARRVRGRIEQVLDWAKVHEMRSGENPARWRGGLQHALPAKPQSSLVRHHPALPYGEIAEFMAALRAEEGTAARCLEFTILTAARTSEAIGARWSEIDLKAAIWTIPASRIKAAREHRVPAVTCRAGVAEGAGEATPRRLRLRRGPSGPGLVEHGDGRLAEAHEAGRHHGSWLSLDLQELVLGADELPERGVGDGAGARGRRQGRGGVPPGRSARQARRPDEGLGGVCRSAAASTLAAAHAVGFRSKTGIEATSPCASC